MNRDMEKKVLYGKWINVFKGVMFTVIIAVICVLLGMLFMPDFSQESNFYGKQCFNKQPENSVETVILGSSVVYHGISPMEMYEAYGISVWDLGSSWQPVSSSYYLLEEAYRLHTESLHTVLFDPFEMTRETNESLRRAITDAIKYNDIKFNAYLDYCDSNVGEALSYTVPLVSYHSRWNEISKPDFEKRRQLRPYLRGYFLDTDRSDFEVYSYDELAIPEYIPDPSVSNEIFENEALFYFKKIIDFCNDHNLKLIIIKTPMSLHWSSSDHNAMKNIAETYGLEFLDFNYLPLFDDIGFNYATDLADTDHMNYYGVRKLTAWLGNYLAEECEATDFRGKAGYEFLEKDLKEYRIRVKDTVDLRAEKDPAVYVKKAMGHEDYTVFITVKEDAASSLTQEQRITFSELGLPALSVLGQYDSYLAVMDPVKDIRYENTEKNPGNTREKPANDDNVDVMEQEDISDVQAERRLHDQMTKDEDKAMEFEGNLHCGESYIVRSGGEYLGDTASCIIDNTEYASGSDGINIIVYDNTLREVIDSAVFNTSVSPVRLGDDLEAELNRAVENKTKFEEMPETLQKLSLYNGRCKEAKAAVLSSGDTGDGY